MNPYKTRYNLLMKNLKNSRKKSLYKGPTPWVESGKMARAIVFVLT